MNSGEHHFTKTLPSQVVQPVEDGIQGHAAAGAAGVWYDAIGAEAVASILDLQKRPGAAPVGRRRRHAEGRGGSIASNPADDAHTGLVHRFDDQTGDVGFVEMADDVVDAADLFDVFGRGLGIAARDDDACGRMPAPQLPDRLAGLHGGLARHGAGVDDAHIGVLVTADPLPAAVFKGLGNGIRLELVDFAAQCGDLEFHG